VKHAYKHNKISWSLLICDKFAHNSKVITQNFPKKVVDRRKSRGVADTRFWCWSVFEYRILHRFVTYKIEISPLDSYQNNELMEPALAALFNPKNQATMQSVFRQRIKIKTRMSLLGGKQVFIGSYSYMLTILSVNSIPRHRLCFAGAMKKHAHIGSIEAVKSFHLNT